MKTQLILFFWVLIFFHSASAATSTLPLMNSLSADDSTDCSEFSEAACAVLHYSNELRAEQNLPAFQLSSRCSLLAQAHAEDMAQNGFFSHTSPTQGSFSVRRKRYELKGAVAENIAYGTHLAPDQVLNLWMKSEGHRAHILSSRYTALGVGIAGIGSRIYYVQCFWQRPGDTPK